MFRIVFAVLAIAAAIGWMFTAGFARACSVTSQLEGSSCYPGLSTIHRIAGPAAIVLGVIALVLIVTPSHRY